MLNKTDRAVSLDLQPRLTPFSGDFAGSHTVVILTLLKGGGQCRNWSTCSVVCASQ